MPLTLDPFAWFQLTIFVFSTIMCGLSVYECFAQRRASRRATTRLAQACLAQYWHDHPTERPKCQ